MAEKYTINTVMPTGKSHPTYGTEYYVKFSESEDTFTLWYKSEPQQGQEQYGTINGNKFKKESKEFKPDENTNVSKKEWTPKSMRKDNSDGMRQGMCINNAANYVNQITTDTLLPQEWAATVYDYANHLYAKGDLTGEVGVEAAPDTVQEVFGVSKPPVPANK